MTDQAFSISQNAAMLPHIFPPYPEREEFDLYASMEPAKETGGDFYDYFLIDDDHLCIVMADVSGKGVPEAMNTVREPFGIGRMLETLNRDPDAEPVRILNNVRNAVRDFAGAAKQFDDITMLCLEYYGANQNSKDKGEEG